MSGREWLLILSMSAVTFAVRYPVLALLSRRRLPTRVLHVLRYIPPAVLAAIIAPAVLMPNGSTLDVSWTNAYLAGGVAAALIAWRTRNLLATIVLGMVVLWGWSWAF